MGCGEEDLQRQRVQATGKKTFGGGCSVWARLSGVPAGGGGGSRGVYQTARWGRRTSWGQRRRSGTTTGTPPAASRPKAGSRIGLVTATARHRGSWWCREREKLGSPTMRNQIPPRLGLHVGGGVTPLIPSTLLVSADIAQPIQKMRLMVSADVSQPIPIIFYIGWLMSADTNIAQPINKPPTDTTVPTKQHSGDGDCSDRELAYFIEIFFHTFSFFAMVYILIDLGLFPCKYSNRDLDFTMISLIDLGLFPCIYSNRSRITHMYIF
jgi:hypothetical protein